MADPGNNPIAVALNTQPKYVASTTLTAPGWANTTVLSRGVAAAIRELKDKPGQSVEVVESQTTPIGVTIQIYRSNGRPQYGTASADMKHVR
jgi:hypothetical protein